MQNKAYFHLPGLFEFLELYRLFLTLFHDHREYFYDWCEIGSIYGAPQDCLWGGGRCGYGDNDPEEVKALMDHYHISARLTFSNSLLRKEHLSDTECNQLCRLFENRRNGIFITSDPLMNYIHTNYPDYYFVSSTTKVLTDFNDFKEELNRPQFRYTVPDFRLNRRFDDLNALTQKEKDRTEFLINEDCWPGCMRRKECYEAVSRLALKEGNDDFVCTSPGSGNGYTFSHAMKNPCFISVKDIREKYLPMGFSNFKIEGRSLGSALVLEFLLYYMTKPEYQLNVREAIYLSNELDLF